MFDNDDDDSNDRDARGRFRKGCSGNPLGRPRKKPPLSEADPYVFAQTLVKLGSGDQAIEMTRREAALRKLFELAMKGNVRALIELRKDWARVDEMRAYGRIRLEQLEREWFFQKRGKDIPLEIEIEILTLRTALNMGEEPDLLKHHPEMRRRLEEILGDAGAREEDEEEDGEEDEA